MKALRSIAEVERELPGEGFFEGGADGLVADLRPLELRPFAGEGWTVISASPELFLARRGSRVWAKPIKGTRPLGETLELAASDKGAGEHVMIVDLERNDLSGVCKAGSIRWPTFAVAEDRIHLWVGGGVVWDSDPGAEIEESLVKVRPLLDAIGAPLREPVRR